ncbi:MAG: TolC family protein [Bacteroidota bacterium]|nr:TolC family protein [Bacteroidota bacterium]
MIKTFKFILLIILTRNISVYAQTEEKLTLEQCYKSAIDYSPLTNQKTLLKQSSEANIRALNAGYFPQAEINAQATYQSDVTKIPISIPKLNIPTLSKDQYKATLDFRQLIFDGTTISKQKQLQISSSDADQQKIELDIQKLKEQINTIYLNVLLIDENIKITNLLKEDINTNIDKMETMVKNGTALKKNLDVLQASLLNSDQILIELKSNRRGLIDMLSVLLGKTLDENIILNIPEVKYTKPDLASNRPEFKLFDIQKNTLQNQSDLISTGNMPKVYFFATGGDGKPGLNFLEDEFKWYYIAGIKLTVPLSNWTSIKEQKQSIEIQKKIVDKQKENFSINNQVLIRQQIQEIEKYQMLLDKDKEIIAKRKEIKEAASVQLLNGVITSDDYLTELNEENQAMQSLKLHEMQLLQAKINYISLTGNN